MTPVLKSTAKKTDDGADSDAGLFMSGDWTVLRVLTTRVSGYASWIAAPRLALG
jgi:hypothetical protein